MPRKVGRPRQDANALNMWLSIEMRRRRRPLSVNGACKRLVFRWDQYEIPHLAVGRLRKIHAEVENRRLDPDYKKWTDEMLAERSGRRRTIRLGASVDRRATLRAPG